MNVFKIYIIGDVNNDKPLITINQSCKDAFDMQYHRLKDKLMELNKNLSSLDKITKIRMGVIQLPEDKCDYIKNAIVKLLQTNDTVIGNYPDDDDIIFLHQCIVTLIDDIDNIRKNLLIYITKSNMKDDGETDSKSIYELIKIKAISVQYILYFEKLLSSISSKDFKYDDKLSEICEYIRNGMYDYI